MSHTENYDPYALPKHTIADPPPSLWTALRRIGPGIILAGSIVGSGELILTTGLGAKYGFVFLGLVIFSCVVKVFVQIELGRYAISSGRPTLGFLNELPGLRLGIPLRLSGTVPIDSERRGANWQVWWWFCMTMATVFQLGAMVGGVSQALHLAFPGVSKYMGNLIPVTSWRTLLEGRPEYPWAALATVTAILLLTSGGYKRVETVATFLVVSITALTVAGVVGLQWTDFAIRGSDLAEGFSNRVFQLSGVAIAAAFSCFGITGVGASELYSYPYWCLEKGYARFSGPREESDAWVRRARGWIRVMQLDAWVSMCVFTAATLAFYFMGAAVLHPKGLAPEGPQMIRTLSEMYRATFGGWAQYVFLVGAGAVLFKTLYVASAGNSRLAADTVALAASRRYKDAAARTVWIRLFCTVFPSVGFILYMLFREPAVMVVIGGFFQAVTLPILAATSIYLRHRRLDQRLRPSRVFDLCLAVAAILITLVAMYAVGDWALNKVLPMFVGKSA